MQTAELHVLVPDLLDYLVEREQVPPCQTVGGQLMAVVARLDAFEAALEMNDAEAISRMASTAAMLAVTIIWMLNQQSGENWSLRRMTPMPSRWARPAELTWPIRRMLTHAYHTAYTNKGKWPRVDIAIALEVALTTLWRIVAHLQIPMCDVLHDMAVTTDDG